MNSICLAAVLVLAIISRTKADELHLVSGQVLRGKIIEQNLEPSEEGTTEMNVEGIPEKFQRIYKIQLGNGKIVTFKDSEVKKATFDSNIQFPSQSSFSGGYIDGVIHAEKMNLDGALVYGYFCGFIGSAIGIGFAFASESTENYVPSVHDLHRISQKGDRYFEGYTASYTKTLKRRRKSAALTGGLAGLITQSAIIVWSLQR